MKLNEKHSLPELREIEINKIYLTVFNMVQLIY